MRVCSVVAAAMRWAVAWWLVWLCGTLAVEEAGEEYVVFLVVRSKSSNTALRSVLRSTWLSGSGGSSGFGYRFFSDETGCCGDEIEAHGDLVARSPAWTHREFELIYPPRMNLKQAAWTGMYSRDWELNCAAWAVRHLSLIHI